MSKAVQVRSSYIVPCGWKTKFLQGGELKEGKLDLAEVATLSKPGPPPDRGEHQDHLRPLHPLYRARIMELHS